MARPQSKRSRAARREPTPESELDTPEETNQPDGKSLVKAKMAEMVVRNQFNDDGTLVNNGVGKRKKSKQISAKQRKRKEAAMVRADSLKSVLEQKVEDAKQHFKVVKDRKKPWEQVNSDLVNSTSSKSNNSFALLDTVGDSGAKTAQLDNDEMRDDVNTSLVEQDKATSGTKDEPVVATADLVDQDMSD